jgi:hypothetical protein
MTFHQDLALSRDGDLLTPHQHHVFPFAFASIFWWILGTVKNTAQENSAMADFSRRSFATDFLFMAFLRHSP